MSIRYDVALLADGKYKYIRVGASGRASSPLSLARSDLENTLAGSVSRARLENALRQLDGTGHVTVDADLEG
jgi:hypothetical protein